MTNEQQPRPGWYADPKMVGTQRYWDGEKWTEHAAPAPANAQSKSDFNGWKVARFVALGILAAVAILWIVGNVLSSNDAAECAQRNLERAMGSDSTPAEVCPN